MKRSNPRTVVSGALLALVLTCDPAVAASRDDCSRINATSFDPMKYSTPSCALARGLSIQQLNACSTEISALGKLVDESWSRAYAAAKAARDKCYAPFLQQDAIDRADEAAKAALNGSLASDLSAYLRGAGTPSNRTAFERVQSVAKLIGDIQNDALGGLNADVRNFTSNPVAPLPAVRSDGIWSVVAHPPTAAALAADRSNWQRSRQEAADARAFAARQQAAAATAVAAQQREQAAAATSSSSDNDTTSATTAAMLGMMSAMMGSSMPAYVRPPSAAAPSRATTVGQAGRSSAPASIGGGADKCDAQRIYHRYVNECN